jgi:hypothetical protein
MTLAMTLNVLHILTAFVLVSGVVALRGAARARTCTNTDCQTSLSPSRPSAAGQRCSIREAT